MTYNIELLSPERCKHEDQYQQKCPMCGTTLDIDTHIFCLENTKNSEREMTVCSDCFYEKEEWLVKEGFFDADADPEDCDDWGEKYGFIHPLAAVK